MNRNRFLRQMRQYAELEDRTGKDFSEAIVQVSWLYIDALVAGGEDPADAQEQVQGYLDNQKLRFPVSLPPVEDDDVSE